MSYIRYKKVKNNLYAYEVTATWDAKLGQSRAKSKYLGRVDEKTKQFIPISRKSRRLEKHSLDFGDGYFLYKLIKNNSLFPILKTHLFNEQDSLEPLMIYSLYTFGKINYYQDWLKGNVLSLFFRNVDVSSQKIIELLEFLGDEQVQNSFFADYLKLTKVHRSIIISVTELCNEPNNNRNFNICNNVDSKIVNQLKLLYVIDNVNKDPLYYHSFTSNNSDAQEIEKIVTNLQAIGIYNSLSLLDQSQFSIANIKSLYDNHINFVIQVPANRTLFQTTVLLKMKDIESSKYATTYEGKSIFVKRLSTNMLGYKINTYIILDPKLKTKEMTSFAATYSEESTKQDKKQSRLAFLSCGISILISSKPIEMREILSCYRIKSLIEQNFSIANKDSSLLSMLDNLANNNQALSGYMFLQFLLLVMQKQIKEQIKSKNCQYTLEQILMVLRRLKCKLYKNQIICEKASQEQEEILQIFEFAIPTNIEI